MILRIGVMGAMFLLPDGAVSAQDRVPPPDAAYFPEPGSLVRIRLRFPPPEVIEGGFWRVREEGLMIEHAGRPEVVGWERIGSVQLWRPAADAWRAQAIGAFVGTVYVGSAGAAWAGGPEGSGALGGALVGGLLGGVLGWIIGHALSADDGSWEPIPLDRLRAPD